jgi:hypothetical protein
VHVTFEEQHLVVRIAPEGDNEPYLLDVPLYGKVSAAAVSSRLSRLLIAGRRWFVQQLLNVGTEVQQSSLSLGGPLSASMQRERPPNLGCWHIAHM